MQTYTAVPTDEVINRTVESLKSRTNIEAVVAESGAQALEMLIGKIREGSEIFPNGSVTLNQIGFTDYLAGNPDTYRNLRQVVAGEPDAAKRAQLRRRTTIIADYYVGSVHAVAETGEVVTASMGGAQLAAYVFGAANVIWVVGAQKIVPNLEAALRRVREHSLPLEDARMRESGSANGSSIGKLLIVERESRSGRISIILVKESLGF